MENTRDGASRNPTMMQVGIEPGAGEHTLAEGSGKVFGQYFLGIAIDAGPIVLSIDNGGEIRLINTYTDTASIELV